MSRILVIDDSKLQRTFARLLLEDSGYEVLEAAGGREGLQLVNEELPDCVLLDLLMPDLSGWEVLQRLKQAGHSMPVIVVTAEERDSGRVACLAQGAAAVVDKADHPRQLLQAVLSALHGSPDVHPA